MKNYYVTYQITQEVNEQVRAESAEVAIRVARTYVEDHCSIPLGSMDIQFVKVEEAE